MQKNYPFQQETRSLPQENCAAAVREWKTLVMKITVPDKVAKIQLCLETLGKDDDVQFDDVSLDIRSGNRSGKGKMQ